MAALTPEKARAMFAGVDQEVPLLDGSTRAYVNLDNAATTPPMRCVLDHINGCAGWYGSVHRGTGYKSQISTYAFEHCRDQIADFIGMDPGYHTLIFCGNATDAVNRLCCRYPLEEDELVLSTVLEHHSNMLPWRFHGKVDYVRARPQTGELDIHDLEARLKEHNGKVRLVTVTGASNVTGLVSPIYDIARTAHAHGAQVLVDASQLIAHRPIRMGRAGEPDCIDFLVFSGHKIYAPFGSGGLVGPTRFFEEGRPGMTGGGAVDLVTLDDVEWAELPDKEEAGTPNLMGICALAKSMETLASIGMEEVARYEDALTAHLIERLSKVEGVRVFGGSPGQDRLGVAPMHCEKYPHGLLASILSYEYGIGVRNGCFCAHPYIEHLFGLDEKRIRSYFDEVRAGNRSDLPGLVRASLALYNTTDEIDYFGDALARILTDGPAVSYTVDKQTGDWRPEQFDYDFGSLCS